MRKKEYMAPEAELELFTLEDIITYSSGIGDGGNEGGDLDAIVIEGDGTVYYLDEFGDVIDPNDVDSIF